MTKREIGTRDHPWLYTAKGHLDLSWLLLVVGCVLIACCLMFEGFHVLGFALPWYAWSVLGSFTGLCFIAGAARDRASILAGATMPGQIARGVAEGARPSYRDVTTGSDAP